MIPGSSPVNHKEQDIVEGETGCHKQWEAEDTLSNKIHPSLTPQKI